jgi:hypothetical protein
VGSGPRQLAEDPGGGKELGQREDDDTGRKPGLQVQRVAEEELEIALVRIDALASEEAYGQGDERERRERRKQPPRSARGRTRLGDDVNGGNVYGE